MATEIDEAPGKTSTCNPEATAARTSLNPGSDMAGVPASDIIATRSPSLTLLTISGMRKFSLCS